MIVVRIDDKAQKVSLISVPRDIWVQLPLKKDADLVGQKINAAYAYGLDDTVYPDKSPPYQSKNSGGGTLAKYALSQLVGEPIEHFVAVSFRTFTNLVDQLGGITITRSSYFSDEWYPVDGKEKDLCDHKEEDIPQLTATLSGRLLEQEFPCRYEKLELFAGQNHLNGAKALKYARSRKSMTEGGDFHRSKHQKEVIEAIKSKALELNSFTTLVSYATTLGSAVDTDFSVTDIPNLVKTYLRKKEYKIESIALTDENVLDHGSGPQGQYILTPAYGQKSWDDVHTYLRDRTSGLSEASSVAKLKSLRDPSPTPTNTPTKTSPR
jgi:anionic cell wall polymer biosynthesis LytR-Cps2A-Psr (LCP) family protein